MLKKFSLTKKQLKWAFLFLAVKILVSLGVLSFGVLRLPAFAQNTANLPDVALQQVATGLDRPVHITHAGDGSGRLFIVEQRGVVFILNDEQPPVRFFDIQERVASPAAGGGNEEGLLSLAFPPGYADKGYFYAYYTMRDGDNVVSRFYLTDDPNLADPDSEEQILVLPHPQYQNHNGGQLAFGPDGYLYIGTGDGGGGGDPLDNGQDPASLNGKLLRIDVEFAAKQQAAQFIARPDKSELRCYTENRAINEPYSIPDDNPFSADTDFRPEIWALGLRNPWRFSFDRQLGDLYIADVGQNRWEEINVQSADSPGGENYGWNIMEGEECYGSSTCDTEGLTLPAFAYPIFSTSDCSVTGGFVYRGSAIPDLDGIYVYGDFCSGRIWGLQQNGAGWQNDLLLNTNMRISTFGEDEQGELFVADMRTGVVYKFSLP